ncbi:MAG: Cd(II)/Pb(II)-responsive transcriptional regulator [gamma proteobacterium symbiont of Bathyaustriella thionipta]|nr:Cd(II)/Pb(II)-responsive transcriptional regulator [gamma proteobacterium symbiont of Bathyaustriella thionipta]MCU7949739.1 Cd(II)/Pb(II)-responsive transcriptional regulator [gamma proteobacterium symbiont of Bathyaustriella thionipta]MCU7952849.1 Cd(II)/Pb(II)-responsive transcriptional regulator [gamma proteobacterium symbiont of Bathyaustriella thionipta]MCU7956321.1 Cd(II)/Pb(II)-responsive transcriptional regulator [gamma proteobacterium symbiont of Bathyaustriella thionipta]MCU796846
MKIGELAKLTGCSIQSIRYYEKEGLLNSILRSEGNFRLYNDESVRQLIFIKRCRSLDISLSEINHLSSLKSIPEQNCNDVNKLFDKHLQQVDLKIEELEKLKNQLLDLRHKCSDKHIVEDCGIIQELMQ